MPGRRISSGHPLACLLLPLAALLLGGMSPPPCEIPPGGGEPICADLLPVVGPRLVGTHDDRLRALGLFVTGNIFAAEVGAASLQHHRLGEFNALNFGMGFAMGDFSVTPLLMVGMLYGKAPAWENWSLFEYGTLGAGLRLPGGLVAHLQGWHFFRFTTGRQDDFSAYTLSLTFNFADL